MTETSRPVVIDAPTLQQLFASYPPFARLSEAALADLASHFTPESVAAGDVLVEIDTPTRDILLVQYGRVRAVIRGPSPPVEVGRGEFLLFFNSISGDHAEGTAYAIRDTTLLRISADDFVAVAGRHPDVVRAMGKVAMRQLRLALRIVGQDAGGLLNFALLPTVAESWAYECEASLRDAFTNTIGPGEVVADTDLSESMEIEFAESAGAPRERIVDWLRDSQSNAHFVLFRGELAETQWTRWCWRQADRTVVAARADDHASIARIDEMFAGRVFAGLPAKVDLLLLHDADVELPRDTRRWLDLACLRRLHHVRRGNAADFERATRRVSERSVGVVLGGGGARGLAHIGVLQALEDSGTPIDSIGGTSMGAVIAGAYAQGWSANEIMERVCEVFAASRAVIDLTFPMASLLAGSKLDRVLKDLFGDAQIEDLWLDYYCMTSSVTESKGRVHTTGSLWKAVRGSVSLPGIFPPVQVDGEVVVDGGVINNVPMDVMRGRCGPSGTVIAVDVGGVTGDERRWDERDRDGISGWRLLGKKALPFVAPEPVPNIFQTLLWSTTLSSKQYTKQMSESGISDLLLSPPVQDFGLLGFEDYRELYDVGYEYAAKKIAAWKASAEA